PVLLFAQCGESAGGAFEIGPSVHVAAHARVLHVEVDALVLMMMYHVVEIRGRRRRRDLVSKGEWHHDRMPALSPVPRRHDRGSLGSLAIFRDHGAHGLRLHVWHVAWKDDERVT